MVRDEQWSEGFVTRLLLWSEVMQEKRRMMAKGNEKRLKKTRILPRRWSQLPLIDSNPSSLSRSLLALRTEGHSFEKIFQCFYYHHYRSFYSPQ